MMGVAIAFAAGCFPPAGARQDTTQVDTRVHQLEQRVTALEQYIRQMYDVLAANGALAAPQTGPQPSPQPLPQPAPAPSPR
jgi:hypothetical protein